MEHRFHDILGSVVTATNYFLNNVYTEGPVIMMGHSSGAQRAALVTLKTSLLDTPDRIKAMVGMTGPYDFYPFTDDDHWDLFGPEDHYPMSQPINYVRVTHLSSTCCTVKMTSGFAVAIQRA